jgi:hypothetical protein
MTYDKFAPMVARARRRRLRRHLRPLRGGERGGSPPGYYSYNDGACNSTATAPGRQTSASACETATPICITATATVRTAAASGTYLATAHQRRRPGCTHACSTTGALGVFTWRASTIAVASSRGRVRDISTLLLLCGAQMMLIEMHILPATKNIQIGYFI